MISGRESRRDMRNDIAPFPLLLTQADPQLWWRQSARFLTGLERKTRSYADQELGAYMRQYVGMAKGMLREAATKPVAEERDIVTLAEGMMMDLSMEMAEQFEPKEIEVKVNHISLSDLVQMHPDRFELQDNKQNGVECLVLRVRHPHKNEWQEIPLPKEERLWHKGGPARAVLDIVAGSALSMQEAEFPWNDYDAVIAGDPKRGKKVADALGIDADGVEHMGEESLNFPKYCAGRDTNQNQVCIGADGLWFSDEALKAAQTGMIEISGRYIKNKAIYGIDAITVDGIAMAKQRGLMRLVKSIVEGKALRFDYLPVNMNFEMGVHILFLAKKWSRKPQFHEYLNRMYYVLNKMGQVREGENDIWDVLERAHRENPFFDFASEVKFPIQVARWKAAKLVKQIDREAAWKHNLPSSFTIKRSENDTAPIGISLDDYGPSVVHNVEFQRLWVGLLERSHERTLLYHSAERPIVERIFGIEYSQQDEIE